MQQSGVIGDPVGHSLSPVMQKAAFAAAGIDADYALWETKAADIPSRIASLRAPDVLGANVTVPHKQIVVSECDEISVTARRIGAVNTIINQHGRLRGENTDTYGFAASLRAAGINDGQQRTALLLGAGGAARAVIVALQELRFDRILLTNRTGDKARVLADELGGGEVFHISWESLADELSGASVVVNATSLGWHDGEMPLTQSQVDQISGNALVADLTYRETDLLRAAHSRDIAAIDGLDMLIHQGARGFTLWTGVEAPVDVMRDAVIAEQQRRAIAG